MLAASRSSAHRVGPPKPARSLQPSRRPRTALQAARQPAQASKNGNGGVPSALSAGQDHIRAVKMVNLCMAYFNDLMSKGHVEVCHGILSPGVEHKDMVRNEGRYGIPEYQRFVRDLKQAYPDIYVRPTSFGVVDDHTMFVAFEGRATADTPLFKGVDLFCFNHEATKIREIQVYRSNWLGAQGHEERKKAAQQGRAQHQPRMAT